MQAISYVIADAVVASPFIVQGVTTQTAIIPVVFQLQDGSATPTVRALQTFGAIPSEASLRYPATLQGGVWVAGVVDQADPKLISSFRLDDAYPLPNGIYTNPNVNNIGPLSDCFKDS